MIEPAQSLLRAAAVRRRALLSDAYLLAPAVRVLRFDVLGDEPFGYVAGQWVDLYVDVVGVDGRREEVKRSYSIASAPPAHPSRSFELAVTLVDGGPVSSALHALPIGAEIVISNPSGFFTRAHPEGAHVVYVGTGTGLSPLRAMLHEEIEGPRARTMTLLFGCRVEADILWREEIEALAARDRRLGYEVTLSRAPESWPGRRGYVQAHLAELVRAEAPVHVYICGLSKMVKEVRRILKEEIGFDRKQVHSERYD